MQYDKLKDFNVFELINSKNDPVVFLSHLLNAFTSESSSRFGVFWSKSVNNDSSSTMYDKRLNQKRGIPKSGLLIIKNLKVSPW